MTAKKTITIDVPDGLPDGWECVGYGKPVNGYTMHHYAGVWGLTSGSGWSNDYLIARRTETAADWANKQPRLTALLQFVKDDLHVVRLHLDGEHRLEDNERRAVYIYAERCEKHMGCNIKPKSGKWVNA